MARRIGIAMVVVVVVVGTEVEGVIIEEEAWEEGCSLKVWVAAVAERGISGKHLSFCVPVLEDGRTAH